MIEYNIKIRFHVAAVVIAVMLFAGLAIITATYDQLDGFLVGFGLGIAMSQFNKWLLK